MDLSKIIAATGGPVPYDHRPDGGSDVVPLAPLGLDRVVGEPAPGNVTAQQGAGGGTALTPNGGHLADGSLHTGGNRPDSSGGPEQLPVLPAKSGLSYLTVGGNFGSNRPS